MFDALFFLSLGLFLGWNTTQPELAKTLLNFIKMQYDIYRK